MKKLFQFFRRFFTRCQCCKKLGAVRYHQNTRYTNEEDNWKTLCPPCQEENEAYWAERWDEYYSGRL